MVAARGCETVAELRELLIPTSEVRDIRRQLSWNWAKASDGGRLRACMHLTGSLVGDSLIIQVARAGWNLVAGIECQLPRSESNRGKHQTGDNGPDQPRRYPPGVRQKIGRQISGNRQQY